MACRCYYRRVVGLLC